MILRYNVIGKDGKQLNALVPVSSFQHARRLVNHYQELNKKNLTRYYNFCLYSNDEKLLMKYDNT